MKKLITLIATIVVVMLAKGETLKPLSSGSGFFITTDGFFLTSHHVIKGSTRIEIRTGDVIYDARLVKADPTNDIAILRVDGRFVALPIGLTDKLTIGDDVFTVGYPAPLIEGFAPKLTKGSINAESGIRDDPPVTDSPRACACASR